MGNFGLGSSESLSTQRTRNEQQTASDQAVVVRAQGRAFQDDRDITVGRNATLTITNGLSREDAQAMFDQSRVNPNSADDHSFKEALLLSLNQRTAANTERATDEATAAAPSKVRNWIKWAIGAVVVFGLVIFFGRKSK